MNVVILNDTATRYHHGCRLVMQNLVAGLQARGLTISLRVASGTAWEDNPQTVAAMAASDLIVINAEGTLHHGRPAAERLLRVGTHPELQSVPKAAVNMLYEDNPDEWGVFLQSFDLLAARDSASCAEVKATGFSGDLRWLPDLSMAACVPEMQTPRGDILLGDSVRWNRRQDLARLGTRLSIPFFAPTKTLAAKIWKSTLAKRFLYALYMGHLSLTQPKFVMPQSAQDYLAVLASSSGHVTGRFHAVCLSMLTQTPFVALTSNASKIERLLTDVGIGTDRIIGPSDVGSLTRESIVAPLSAEELEKISLYLKVAHTKAEILFDDLASLAQRRAVQA